MLLPSSLFLSLGVVGRGVGLPPHFDLPVGVLGNEFIPPPRFRPPLGTLGGDVLLRPSLYLPLAMVDGGVRPPLLSILPVGVPCGRTTSPPRLAVGLLGGGVPPRLLYTCTLISSGAGSYRGLNTFVGRGVIRPQPVISLEESWGVVSCRLPL